MSVSRSSRLMFAVLGVIVLGLTLPPLVSVRHFRDRITGSISQALNRQVSVEKVHLRLLPQPGFDLEKFIVYDQPSFSAEPMLRADEVTAILRLSSLWRGRLEIATLSLKQPSLNLVRDDRGLWNIEALLQRASSIPTAPTANMRPEAKVRFPYIEADTGRINFKFGPEKKVYALTDADFALWLSSENEWSMRLEARPVRTDINIADSGTLKLDGTFKRAANLGATPLHFNLHLERAQLGQVTRLIYGRDRGWRGAIKLDAAFVGTPANLAITADTSIQDFRRYDIFSGQALRLVTRCSARYSAATQVFSQIACSAPSGGGLITARGTASGFPRVRRYDVAFEAARLPMQSLIAMARHAKQGLPDDLLATGTVNATFSVRKPADDAPAAWSGSGETSDFSLRSNALGEELALGSIPFSVAQSEILVSKHSRKPIPKLEPGSQEFLVRLGPFDVPLGATTSANATGWIARSGYDLNIAGDARISRLLQVAHSLGVRAPQLAVEGTARFDLDLAGKWSGFAPATATGRAQLRAVTARMKGVGAPLQVASATVVLSPDELKIQSLSAFFPDIGPHLTGSLVLARQCDLLSGCPVRFDLHADELISDDLDQLLNPRRQKRPWYQLLTGSDASVFVRVLAEGHLSADRFVVRSLDASHVSADVQIDHGKLRLSDLRADVLGGHHTGEWHVDFTAKPPLYSGRGALDKFSLGQLSDAMHDAWATGTASLTYSGTMSGWTAGEMFSSSAADFHFDWRQGTLRHLALEGSAPPLNVLRFTGEFDLLNRLFTISAAKLQTPAGTYSVAGTVTGIASKTASESRSRAASTAEPSSQAITGTTRASAANDRSVPSARIPVTSLGSIPTTDPIELELSLKLAKDSLHRFNVTGTLANPHVVPAASAAEAALKP